MFKTILPSRGRLMHLSCVTALSIAFMAGTAPVRAADVGITSGTVLASYAATGAPPVAGVQMQGTGFSLNGSGLMGNATLATTNLTGQKVTSVTFNPAMSETLSGPPFVFAGTVMQLVSNGTTYTDQSGSFLVVTMSFSGPKVTAPNTSTAAAGNYSASVSNVPFSMTGSVEVHSGSAKGPVVATIPISGVGLYTSSQQGTPGAAPSGSAKYQFQTPSPTLFTLDTSTQGTWSEKYGTEGYMIAGGASSPFSTATVSLVGQTAYTWATQTTDARALQNVPGSNIGTAAAYTQDTSKGFTINAKFTDGKAHQVALYLLDWDTFTRTQTITITDVATNTVLDTETLSTFHEGYYAIWNLQGNVTITVTPKVGTTPAVSGVFIDPAGGSVPASGFVLTATAATVPAGTTGSATVTVIAASGFVSKVDLAASGWPAGITGTFEPNPTTSTSTATITVGPDVAPGPYSLKVKGTSGALSANATIALTVTTAPPPVFTLSASDVTIAAGFSGYSTLTATPPVATGDPNFVITTPSAWPAGIMMLPQNGNSTLGISAALSVAPGVYTLPINVHNVTLNADATATIALTVTAGPTLDSAATFVGPDSATQGAWNGRYGADGFLIADGANSVPAYATVDVTGASTYTWATLTTDVRALQTGKGETSGIASTYNAMTFNITVNLTDGGPHQVGLYFLDWDTTVRAQSVVIMDAATNAILDVQSFNGFHDGLWAVWNLKGNIIIQLTTASSSADAVMSGIFFDPAIGASKSSRR